MYEASVLILQVMYMVTHTQTHSKTHVYALTHLDHSPISTANQHPIRGRPHTVDLPPHQRGRELEGRGQRKRGR